MIKIVITIESKYNYRNFHISKQDFFNVNPMVLISEMYLGIWKPSLYQEPKVIFKAIFISKGENNQKLGLLFMLPTANSLFYL